MSDSYGEQVTHGSVEYRASKLVTERSWVQFLQGARKFFTRIFIVYLLLSISFFKAIGWLAGFTFTLAIKITFAAFTDSKTFLFVASLPVNKLFLSN